MAPSTTSTKKTTTINTTRAKPLSTPIRLPSFARAPKHTAVPDADAGAELVSLWPRPRVRRASSSSSTSSASSSSSASSATSSSSASSSSGSGSTSTKKSKSTKTRAVDMIVSGGSSLLIMSMPFLQHGSPPPPSPPSDVSTPQTPRKRRFRYAAGTSRGGAQAALLVIDAARVDARDSGMEVRHPPFPLSSPLMYIHAPAVLSLPPPRSPSLLRALASSQRTGPIHPHPESDSVSRDADATTAGDDGGGTHMVFFERAALGSARDGHPQFSIATSISAGPCHSSRAAASSASHLSAVAGPLVGRGADFAGFDFDRGARC
ncbi:hypothetical protein DFH09DRAFT_1369096 [Mycena vulgaris]|nr:hypothetical protein DFH09DRAFT_1369096 [Mycena vulgaris]